MQDPSNGGCPAARFSLMIPTGKERRDNRPLVGRRSGERSGDAGPFFARPETGSHSEGRGPFCRGPNVGSRDDDLPVFCPECAEREFGED